MKSTKNIKVPEKIVDQVLGQEEAVKIIKKAAQQRRHVFLIGEPGTGKSMLGLALAELMPNSDLKDILSYPNPNDENNPLINTLPAGKGREEVQKYQFDANSSFKNNNFWFFIILIVVLAAPWFAWNYYSKFGTIEAAIMTAASLVIGILAMMVFSLAMNMGPKMFKTAKSIAPKVIVDNFDKKQAPFFDATGTHAGALLGDVLHDPFQCFFTEQWLQKKTIEGVKFTKINEQIDSIMKKHKNKITKKEKNNYETVHLPKNELSILGETNGSISSVEVLSCNRHDYIGEMIKLTTSENKELIVTPEHKIALWKNGKTNYVEARNIKTGDQVVAQAEDIIIDEQDIINTYDEKQQEQCRLYYKYQELKTQNPTWGYKRISKTLGQPEAKTRWWHSGKHTPTPIQTINWLKEKGLIPLKIDNLRLPLMAKILGATFGDGGIFENLNGIFLSSSELEAVKEFGEDLTEIFGDDVEENSRIIEGGEYGHSWCYQNTNRNIIRFFIALGTPKGNKTKLELKIPSWISLKQSWEDEFFGSFFGGELGSPSLHKKGNRLTTLEVGITGKPQFNQNRIEFFNKIADYLTQKKVYCNSIYIRKLNEESIIYRLQIKKKMDNVLYFLMNTKLNYCEYKKVRLYKALGNWSDLKIKKYEELIKKGYGAEHAMKTLNLTPNSLYLLLNHFKAMETEA